MSTNSAEQQSERRETEQEQKKVSTEKSSCVCVALGLYNAATRLWGRWGHPQSTGRGKWGNSGGRLMGWAGTFLHRGQNECKIINGRKPVEFQKPGLTGQSLATSFRAVRQTIAKLQPLLVFTEEK
jgi:hypothetical protein